jgi:SPP1 gp7 family putative phage head morphogenesis protein
MSANDEVQSKTIIRQIRLARVEEQLARDVQVILRSLKKRVEKELVFFYPNKTESAIFKKEQLNEFLKEIDGLITDSYKRVKDTVEGNINSVAASQDAWTQKTINNAFKAPLITKTLGKRTLENYARGVFIEGTRVGDWINKGKGSNIQSLAKKYNSGIERIVRNNLILGLSNRATVKEVSDFSTLTRRDADAIVRTASQTASNQVSLDVFKLNDDVIKGVQWVATLDKRTTVICIELDNLIWKYDKQGFLIPDGHGKVFPGPIAHWRCRSTQIPVTIGFGDLDSKTKSRLEDMPESTRQDLGGQVTEPLNARQWLERQSRATQDDILGIRKAQLLRDGKLDNKSLTDFSNNPLTLKDLDKSSSIKQAAKPASKIFAPAKNLEDVRERLFSLTEKELNPGVRHKGGVLGQGISTFGVGNAENLVSLNQALKGFETVLNKYGVRVNRIEFTTPKFSHGAYTKLEAKGLKKIPNTKFFFDTLAVNKRDILNPTTQQKVDHKAFLTQKSLEIKAVKEKKAGLEKLIKEQAELGKTSTVKILDQAVKAQNLKLDELNKTKRWTISSDPANLDQSVFATATHESYHAVYTRNNLFKLFESNLEKNNVTILDRLAVSENGFSSSSELFAEIGAGIETKISGLPENIVKAFNETLSTIEQ